VEEKVEGDEKREMREKGEEIKVYTERTFKYPEAPKFITVFQISANTTGLILEGCVRKIRTRRWRALVAIFGVACTRFMKLSRTPNMVRDLSSSSSALHGL
jgi:hypothetical protein